MAAKLPITVRAAAICQGERVAATSSPETPRPRKNTIIIARLPHWSPSLPAGTEPRPNMTKAPIV